LFKGLGAIDNTIKEIYISSRLGQNLNGQDLGHSSPDRMALPRPIPTYLCLSNNDLRTHPNLHTTH